LPYQHAIYCILHSWSSRDAGSSAKNSLPGWVLSQLLTYEQQYGSNSNWKLGVYPTIAVPEQKVPAGTMYVLEENGGVCQGISS
jgi:hypothetical protein